MNKKIVGIIGAGPAGLTAAIYLQRANIDAIFFDGDAPGGKMVKTAHVENYPGFKKINGADLAYSMFDQALSLGAKFEGSYVSKIKQEAEKFIIFLKNNKEFIVDAIFIANGTENRKLSIPGEKEFFNKGVSYCAICDSSFFKGEDIAVVGSGNSAAEESVFLSNIGKNIHLFVRGENLKCDETIKNELEKLENVHIHFNSRITQILGNNAVESITIVNDKEKHEYNMPIKAVFPFIGLDPISIELETNKTIEKNDKGFIIVDNNMRTNIPGIYAIGDIVEKKYRQIATAISDGTVAALNSIEYLKNSHWK